MDTDLAALEDRIYQIQHRNESYAALQEKYLKRTGTEAWGYSRGYVDIYRGFGQNAVYGPMVYNAVIFQDLNLRSIPVPQVLFDVRVRCYRTFGLYYASDPIIPEFDLRWLSLSSFNEYCTLTAGDFYKHYTPLTLWNYEVPVFTFIEPTSYYRSRKDAEEIVFMDHGPDYRLRGFQASTAFPSSDNLEKNIFSAQAMVSPLKLSSQFLYGDYLAGSQASLGFFDHNLEIIGTGLVLWDDSKTANLTDLYLQSPDFSALYPKQYKIGSISGRLKIPFDKEVSLAGTYEYAGANYQDDLNNPQRIFEDWAVLSTGALNVYGAHLTAKFINNGPFFYSPGAQTNRYTPGSGNGYLSSDANLEEDTARIPKQVCFPGRWAALFRLLRPHPGKHASLRRRHAQPAGYPAGFFGGHRKRGVVEAPGVLCVKNGGKSNRISCSARMAARLWRSKTAIPR